MAFATFLACRPATSVYAAGMIRTLLWFGALCLAACASAASGPSSSTTPVGSAQQPPPLETVAGSEEPLSVDAPADVAAAPPEAEVTSSGLASRSLRAGSGTEHPTATSQVTVRYSGWTTDGELFDSSVQRGQPASFRLDEVIPGWTEGLQLMVVGEQRRFWIPGALAYDNSSRPGVPKGTLVFDVELLAIE